MAKTSIIAEPDKQEVIISRIFEARRELVSRMWTDAAYIPEWWGQRHDDNGGQPGC